MATSFYQGSFGSELPALTIGDQSAITASDERATRFNRSSASVAYGLAVVRDNSEPLTGAIIPTATSQKLVGVAINDGRSIMPSSSNARAYADDDSMTLQVVGAVAMEAGNAITADDPVYIETSGADAGKPFGADNATAGSYTLTLDKALAGGVKRIQTITFSADLSAGNLLDGAINASAITQVTFATDHGTTMGLIVNSIEAKAAALGLDLEVALTDAVDNRVITIVDNDAPSATGVALTAFAVTAGAAVVTTVADAQAGIAPASVSVSVNAVTVTTAWSGTSESTMLAFAQELDAQTGVTSAILNAASTVIALASSIPLTLASGTVTGGEGTPATLTTATVAAGVASTRIAWTSAKFLSEAADGAAVNVRFDARF